MSAAAPADLAAFAAEEVLAAGYAELRTGYADLLERVRSDVRLLQTVAASGVDAGLELLPDLQKPSGELVTAAEHQAEERMRALVLVRYPDAAVIGEELGSRDGAGPLWVFDPVDGTSALVRTTLAIAAGVPAPAVGFGITIAVVAGNRAVIGVVGELAAQGEQLALPNVWVGRAGAPTTRNGVPVRVTERPLPEATLASTVPDVMFPTRETRGAFDALRARAEAFVPDLNCIGFTRLLDPSDNGKRVDLVLERDLSLPDAGALVPILLGGGATVTDADGGPVRFDEKARSGEYTLLAAAPGLHAEALAALRAAPPARSSSPARAAAGYVAKFGARGAGKEEPMNELARLARPDIYALKPYSSARTEGSQTAEIFLDANENPYPPYPGGPEQQGLNRYPEPQPQHLLERFAQLYDVPAENLFLSRGADEAIDLLVRAFCAAGTGAILTTPPTFVMYETAARIQGAAVHEVPLTPDFQLDTDAVIGCLRENPGITLVFLCSPNNPTANLLDRREVLRLAAEAWGRALVVVDSTYAEYSGEAAYSPEVSEHPNLVVLRTLSKEYSLAGERFGVTVAHPEVIGILRRVMAPYPLPVTVIRTVTDAITDEGLTHGRARIKLLREERARLAKELAEVAAVRRVWPSDANYLLVQVDDPVGVTAALERQGIKIRNRDAVVPGAVRITVGTPAENDRLLNALEAL